MGRSFSELSLNELKDIKSRLNAIFEVTNKWEMNYASFDGAYTIFRGTAELGNFLTIIDEEIGKKIEVDEFKFYDIDNRDVKVGS